MGSLIATTTPGVASAAGAANAAKPAKGAGVSLARIFIARQPIFDLQAEGLRLRTPLPLRPRQRLQTPDPDQASAKVMTDGTLILSMEALSGGKLVFINVTHDILLNDYISLLPRDLTAAEIPETIEPDIGGRRRVQQAQEGRLHDRPGRLRLQRAVRRPDEAGGHRQGGFPVHSGGGAPAGSVALHGAQRPFPGRESRDARSLQAGGGPGIQLFQGYFFSKPVIISSRDVPGFKLNYLQMLQEIQLPGVNFDHLEAIIKRDMALSFKLLRYINSAYFGLSNKVSSIMHAITLLGAREFKQWASLVVMASMGSDKPDELVIQALIRGRFCESLAPMLGMKQRAQELFLMGMFSVIDAILDRPLRRDPQGPAALR